MAVSWALPEHQIHLQEAVNAGMQEWNDFRLAAHKCQVMHFTEIRSTVQGPPATKTGNTFSAGGGFDEV